MTSHLTVSIRGLEDRLTGKVPKKYGSWRVLSHKDTGELLTMGEVWREIQRCKKLGYEVIPTCDNHDDKGHCKGHKDNE